MWGAQRTPTCRSKDINSGDGTHVPNANDTAINHYESFDACLSTSMSTNNSLLAGLYWRQGRKRVRWEKLKEEERVTKEKHSNDILTHLCYVFFVTFSGASFF